MKLWVRSQDKECLTKVEHLYIDNENKIRQDCDLILGEYKSKKRALEVLDEIQDFIKREDYAGNRYYEGKIYEMPKE